MNQNDHTFQLLAEEVLGTHPNPEDRDVLIPQIIRLSSYIGDRRERLRQTYEFQYNMAISEGLSERILSAVSTSNVAQFIEQLHLAHNNMGLQVARASLAASKLSAGGVSGSSRIQGTPFVRPSTNSGKSAGDAAVAVTRAGPDPDMARLRAGAADADADIDQTQAIIDGAVAVTEAAGPGAAAAAKSESDDDSAPADSRIRKPDEADDRKPSTKRS